MKRTYVRCQDISWRGHSNQPGCVYDREKKYSYNDLGIIGTSKKINFNDPRQFRILLMGNEMVSGEFIDPSIRLGNRLEAELAKFTGKDIVVINAGVRNSSTLLFERLFPKLEKVYRPHMSLFLMRDSSQLSLSYFVPEKLVEFCPLKSMLALNVENPFPLIFEKPNALFKMIAHTPKNKIFWTTGDVFIGQMLERIPGCDWMKTFVNPRKLPYARLQDYISLNDLPINVSLSFVIARRKSIPTGQVDSKTTELFNQYMAEALVPWLIPEII